MRPSKHVSSNSIRASCSQKTYLFDHELPKYWRAVSEDICEGRKEDAEVFGIVDVPELLDRLSELGCY